MNMWRSFLLTASTVLGTMLPMAVTTLDGCDGTCTPLDGITEDSTLDASEQDLVDEYGYFNLVGDCVGAQDLECEERLPDTCAVACASGATCVQVELERLECNDIVEWSDLLPGYDAGYKWKRKCVEIPAGS